MKITKNENSKSHKEKEKNIFIDEFWNDCLDDNYYYDKPLYKNTKEMSNGFHQSKNTKSQNKLRSKNSSTRSLMTSTEKKNTNKNKTLLKTLSNCNMLRKNLEMELENESIAKERHKKAMHRCISMHDYYIKRKAFNAYEGVKYENVKKEMHQNSFKPKLNKINDKNFERMLKDGDDFYIELNAKHKQTKDRRRKEYDDLYAKKQYPEENESSYRNEEEGELDEEGNEQNNEERKNTNHPNRFKPRKYTSSNYNQTYKETSVYDKKENNEFILRYQKARDIHVDCFEKVNHPRNYFYLETINNTVNWVKVDDSIKKRNKSLDFNEKKYKQNLHNTLVNENADNDDYDDLDEN